MTDERRQSSLEVVLMALGEVKQIGEHTRAEVTDLKNRVGIQNGKVGKLEQWQSFMRGALAAIGLLVLPICLYVLNEILSRVKF